MSTLNLFWTPRFVNKLSKYNGVQDFIALKVAEIVKKYEANSITWSYELEKLKDQSFGKVKAYRMPITEGDRLIIVVDDNNLTLVDIGNHDVMDEYSRMPRLARERDLLFAVKPEKWFSDEVDKGKRKSKPDKEIIVKISDILSNSQVLTDSRWLYESELNAEWVQFLDAEQQEVVHEILGKIEGASDKVKIFFLMGGPGTGKTVILQNLAIQLSNKGRSVSLQVSSQVEKYLKRGLQKVPGINLGFGPGVTVLLDDPANIDEFTDALRKARSNRCAALVIGFDPLQWHERKMEEKFRNLCESNEYEFFPLWKCYRQSYGVGNKTHELIERIYGRSSRFLVLEKQEAEMRETKPHLDLTLGMQFVDAQGRYKVCVDRILNNIEEEATRIKKRVDLWSHTPAACFIFEDELISEYRKLCDVKFEGINRISLSFSNYRNIRGIEFQELYLFVTKAFWKKILEGEHGLGAKAWEKLTSLHTILSRPKDSLVIFVI